MKGFCGQSQALIQRPTITSAQPVAVCQELQVHLFCKSSHTAHRLTEWQDDGWKRTLTRHLGRVHAQRVAETCRHRVAAAQQVHLALAQRSAGLPSRMRGCCSYAWRSAASAACQVQLEWLRHVSQELLDKPESPRILT